MDRKIGVVMTSDNNDPEDWQDVIGNKHRRNEMAKKFKNDISPLKIAVVVDMWLTGFDVPSLATMYVYKQMAGHNLMQAIARVNRVFSHKTGGTVIYKEGGLIVDYVGIASAFKQAMNDYTNRDKNNYGDTDIAKTALPKFIEKLEVCRSLFHGFNYSAFMTTESDLICAQTITGGVNFLSSIEKPKTTAVKKSYGWPDSMAAEPSPEYTVTTDRKTYFSKNLCFFDRRCHFAVHCLTRNSDSKRLISRQYVPFLPVLQVRENRCR
jgi:type I restriction enzyme R subunit